MQTEETILAEVCDICGEKSPYVGMLGSKFACYDCYDKAWQEDNLE